MLVPGAFALGQIKSDETLAEFIGTISMADESLESSVHLEDGMESEEYLPLVPIDDPELAGLPPVPLPPPLPDLETYQSTEHANADGTLSPGAPRDSDAGSPDSEDASTSGLGSDSTSETPAARKKKPAGTKVRLSRLSSALQSAFTCTTLPLPTAHTFSRSFRSS